ncbi:MAG: ATP-binding protein [Candidatus Omnitrophica bacterium]|nr:ATP-binding protein [Candidatus Omnitrophota bacterium]
MSTNAIFILTLAITTLILAIMLNLKINKVNNLQRAVDNLKRSLDEMDEQAKLIVRTDMELNRTQEELDKKITGLYALQRISRAISTTLQENMVFKMLGPPYLEDLGFEKAVAFVWNEKERKFILNFSLGYSEDETRAIKSFVDSHTQVYLGLIKKEETVSSLSLENTGITKEEIRNVFKSISFILSPILPKEGNRGFLFVGTDNTDITISAGDEELITILTNQIGQALENARLFENTWRAHQALEKKVEERTQELRRALEEVRIISKRKSDFISAVSHELRTPLTSIKGYASILLTGKLGQLTPEVQERLDKINRHSDELTHLVNNLLDISRIESGKITMRQEVHNLKEIANSVLELLSPQISAKQINTICEIPENCSMAYVDKEQIRRVFINIIGNAIKFTPEGGTISIRSEKTDSMIQVSISDTGCGIPEEAKEAIFEEFYRVDNPINQQVKGTGLGLSLVKNIIQAHAGKIWVESKLGKGSTFIFTIPMPTQ